MSLKLVLWSGSGVLALAVAALVAWIFSLPPATAASLQPPISAEEADATLAALRPSKRERPLIAIIGINDATETTDYLMPYGILRRADVADVVTLATGPGPIKLFPVLTVRPDATTAAFDEQHPEGADYIIVPAMSRDDDPAVLKWINDQAQKGATVIGICVGAKVVGAAGLLDHKRATTHWFSLKALRNDHPSVVYVSDRRIVVDQKIATTTGITASMPMMLTLIEAIAGRAKAEAVGRDLGLPAWDARHDSSAFTLTPLRHDGTGQRSRLLEPGPTGYRTDPGYGRGFPRARCRRLVTDLPIQGRDIRSFDWRGRNPQRHPHHS